MNSKVIFGFLCAGLLKIAALYATTDPQLAQAAKDMAELITYMMVALHIGNPPDPAAPPTPGAPSMPGLFSKLWAAVVQAIKDSLKDHDPPAPKPPPAAAAGKTAGFA
jgi:hypothetical protein